MTYGCPAGCGAGPFSTQNGAVMHAINKTDDDHDHISNKTEAYSRLEAAENPEAAEESEGTPEDMSEETPADVTTPEFPEAPDGPNDDPVTVDSSSAADGDLDDDADPETPDNQPDGPVDESDDSSNAAVPAALLTVAAVFGAIALRRRGSQTDNSTAEIEVV